MPKRSRSLHEILVDIGVRKLGTTPNGYKGCCHINPEHYDTSPSMHIHVEKGYVKCFSCQAFKDLFSFLVEEGVPFSEAVDFLFANFRERDQRETKGMQEYLLPSDLPKSLIDRGFTEETLNFFEVGYDKVKGRIVIPMRFNKTLYGIKYRRFPKEFWYSDGFLTDNFIYNYSPTKDRYYVEGETDTFRVFQNGTKNVSATLGAGVSDNQIMLMAKHENIFLAFDHDKAGIKGNFRIHRALRSECEIKVIAYNTGDPGECTKEDWQKAVQNPKEFIEYELMIMQSQPKLYNEITALYGK